MVPVMGGERARERSERRARLVCLTRSTTPPCSRVHSTGWLAVPSRDRLSGRGAWARGAVCVCLCESVDGLGKVKVKKMVGSHPFLFTGLGVVPAPGWWWWSC